MTASPNIIVQPAGRRDADRLRDFLDLAPPALGSSEGTDTFYTSDLRTRVVALSGDEIVGSCFYYGGEGHCAVIPPPRMFEWNPDVAARLCRAAAALAAERHGARLIQALLTPEAAAQVSAVFVRAGFELLAVLSYQRRPAQPTDLKLEPPTGLEWVHYSLLRHGRFARSIELTYQDSLDCPKLAGLRPIDDTVTTHKRTGTFMPRTWRLAIEGGKPVGVALVNDIQARGELIYLGVVPAARGRGMGRALLNRAIRDSAEMGLTQMGLAVDVANTPAVRLYEAAGFREIRRRMAYFVPAAILDKLGQQDLTPLP
jgi:RimJ/RimL family protein N-acetyltransferase